MTTYRKQASSSTPPKEGRGVKFFQQFPRNFVEPYTPTVEAPGDEKILRRLKPFNCELLQRPKIGMSELSAGIVTPLAQLNEMQEKTVVSSSVLQKLNTQLATLVEAIKPLNQKSEAIPTGANVKEVLKAFVSDNPDLHKLMENAFMVSSNLFTLSTNFLVARALFRNPEKYAAAADFLEGVGDEFVTSPGMVKLKSMFRNVCLGKDSAGTVTTTTTTRRNLAVELDSSDEEEQQPRRA